MGMEIFFVSVVFWAAVLILFVLLNRRLGLLAEKVTDLERMQGKEGKP